MMKFEKINSSAEIRVYIYLRVYSPKLELIYLSSLVARGEY